MRNIQKKVITTETEEIVSYQCDNCGSVIPITDTIPAPGLLIVQLHGGWQMYFDSSSSVSCDFCEVCADKLLAAFPAIKKAIGEAD